MKIGFVTTHQYKNFGTFLQCYALQYVLTKLGHQVEIIDYQKKIIIKDGWKRLE